MYYFICIINFKVDDCDKMFINIMSLFNRWKIRTIENQKKLLKAEKNSRKSVDKIHTL
jgi:hypothetical protein